MSDLARSVVKVKNRFMTLAPDDRLRPPDHLRNDGDRPGRRRRCIPLENSDSRNEQNHRGLKT
jgi:hypothetical protein